MSTKEMDLKKLMSEGKVIIGSDRTLKLARKGELSTIILASNIPKDKMQEAKLIGSALGIEVIESTDNSKQLGIKLGKPFTVLMIGIKR